MELGGTWFWGIMYEVFKDPYGTGDQIQDFSIYRLLKYYIIKFEDYLMQLI